MSEPSRTLRAAIVALVLAVITLVLHARVALGGMTWSDIRYHTHVAPPRLAAAEAMLAGEAPTWWDGTALGVPLLGDPSHGAAYPLSWLAASPFALDLLALVHLLWLALGVAVLARRLGASDLASVIAGALVAASGIAASSALSGGLAALAHLPWIAWAALGASRRHAAVLGLALGAVGLTGQLCVFVDAIVLAAALAVPRRWPVVAIACGIAISAAQWLPAIAAAGDLAGASTTSITFARLLELVLPRHIAGALVPSLYIGAPVLALATLGRPSRRMMIAAAVAFVLAFATGRGGDWPHWFGAPELHLAVVAGIAAAHAGTGIDSLFARERRSVLALGGAAIAIGLALAAVAVLRSRTEDATPELDRALLDGTIALVCTVGLGVLVWRVRRESPLVALAIAGLLVAPSAGSLGATAPLVDRDSVTTPPLYATAAAKAIDTTNPRLPLRVYRPVSLYEDEHTAVDEAIATLAGASASRFGLAAARSEDPARPAVHDRVWLAASSVGGALFERYGISLAILPGAMVQGRGIVELARRGTWSFAQFPATPPAAMVYEWLYIADDAAALARLFPPGAGRGLPGGLVVLHGSGREQQDEPRDPEPCTVKRWARGAIDMTCAGETASVAVVSSTSLPGWTVHVDGKDTPWMTADVMRRAVPLEPGAHVVSWRYSAPGLLAGVLVALVGLLALIALAFVPARLADRVERGA